MGRLSIEKRLTYVKFNIHGEPHITIDTSRCRGCDYKPCIKGCPAGLFTLVEGDIHFNYEGCLECGTCRIICPRDAVKWSYPIGGYGVKYSFG